MAATDQPGKTLDVPIKDATGKKWFYCGVPGHCEGGMYGTIIIGKAADNTTTPGKETTPGTSTGTGNPSAPTGTGGTAATPSSDAGKASSAVQTYISAYVVSAGVVFSSMCMAAYML